MDVNDLHIWVVYDHSPEFPSGYMARMHTMEGPTDQCVTAPTLEAVREAIQARAAYVLNFFPRTSSDNDKIIECWM